MCSLGPPRCHVIPRRAHFLFGLRPQTEPFHLLQYLAVKTCLDHVRPDEIVMHVHNLPYGVYWDLARPLVTLDRIGPAADLPTPTGATFDYSYAHHADVLRLDVLAAEGGLYADIDTLFVRSFPDLLWRQPSVIGEEADVWYVDTEVWERSLSNAVLMAPAGATFIRRWREQIIDAMDGSWSGHSCRLATRLANQMPDEVHVEPRPTFHPFDHTVAGMRELLVEPCVDGQLDATLAVHTCAHLWWSEQRQDFSRFSSFDATAARLATAPSPLGLLTRDHLPPDVW
jgi:Glycosyltransferase sugar-binding region containing DXD motif